MVYNTIVFSLLLFVQLILFSTCYNRRFQDNEALIDQSLESRWLDRGNQYQWHPWLRFVDQFIKRKAEQNSYLAQLRRGSLYDELDDDDNLFKRGETTGATGGGQPFDNMQPSTVLNQIVAINDVVSFFIVRTFAFNYFSSVPIADGRSFSATTSMYALSTFGSTFGGDGKANFKLPDLRGTAIVGAGQGDSLSMYQRGQKSGFEKLTLTVNQMPTHSHAIPDSNILTGRAGGSEKLNNIQPSLAMNYIICVDGMYPVRDGGLFLPFLGQIVPFLGTEIPSGWRLANGDILSASQNPALFSILGQTFGGNDPRSFRLPDLRGRVPVGTGGESYVRLGQKIGTESIQLTESHLPPHAHTLPRDKYPNAAQTTPTGDGRPVDNRQPSLGITYFICSAEMYPDRDAQPSNFEDPLIGEIYAFAGDFAPGGCMIADGRSLLINQNTALFSLLGTTFGGNGRTFFQIPDLRNQTIVGSGLTFRLGQRLGTPLVTLLVSNLPSHSHTLS